MSNNNNNLRLPRSAMTPPPTPAAASSSSAPLLPVTAEPLPTAEQTVVVRQPSFPFPVYHWQPRRHFSGGPGVGYFSDPARGRAVTVSIFETSARLYPAVRHHHIRMTTITAAGNRNLYRAALFLVDQPDHLTYDMRGVPGTSDSGGSYSGGSFGQTNDIVLIGIGRGHGNGNGSSIGSRIIRAQNGRGHGNGGGVAVENGSSGLGNNGGRSDNNDAGNGNISGNSSRSGYDGDDEDDGEDIDVYIGPYSSGIPEYRQRLVLIGPIGNTVDEALEGLEGVVVREWDRQIA
ncbi:hypothetical protein DIS24_g10653 [Lasiodiplodia hormozganensis]|uniref:Uncharacterized protein n=1 Tax=Lasiodiplodia hormozganensis TaxID=869390 RepID=A0AA39XP26_9PEZI|nr:hypothetical protein DIS24_g10653 [Lasiodiplodia hormozganensis]